MEGVGGQYFFNHTQKMKLLSPEVAKVIAALGGNVGKNHVETDPEKIKQQEIAAAARLEHAQKMEAAGISKSDIEKYMKNANEVMHTGNTGYGEELIPTNVLSEQVIDMIPTYGTFLPSLPGFHGTNMPVSQLVDVIGEVPFFDGNTEPTTGALGPVGQATHKLGTAKVTITQSSFIAKVAISKKELNHSITDLEALIKERLARSAVRTIEALILNADSANAGATGNVNLDDSTPASTAYYMQQANGLRRLALATAIDAGTLDTGDFIDLMNLLGDLFGDGSNCLWLTNRRTYNKALGLDSFADAAKRGEKSTIAGNAVTNVHGADVFIGRDVPLTEADGKVSVTAGNNVKGGIHLLYKPSVQYGYGQPLEIDIEKVPGKGVNIVATFEFGFSIAQKLAGMTDSSVASAIDITV